MWPTRMINGEWATQFQNLSNVCCLVLGRTRSFVQRYANDNNINTIVETLFWPESKIHDLYY